MAGLLIAVALPIAAHRGIMVVLARAGDLPLPAAAFRLPPNIAVCGSRDGANRGADSDHCADRQQPIMVAKYSERLSVFAAAAFVWRLDALGCERTYPAAALQLSRDPASPLEPAIAPLAFELKRLGVFDPCRSCEGHNDAHGRLIKWLPDQAAACLVPGRFRRPRADAGGSGPRPAAAP